jgi:hydrogenase-1 operon protein HyaE
MDSSAIEDMLDSGVLARLTTDSLADFLASDRLCVLFFAGGNSQRSDAHDVAVALREVLREYPGSVQAGLVEEAQGAQWQQRFRVLVSPSLVLTHAGSTLEVIPKVRDWADYARAFQRYLGPPAKKAVKEARA